MKLTWEILAKMIAAESGVDPRLCERVMRTFGRMTGARQDFQMVMMNAFHDLQAKTEDEAYRKVKLAGERRPRG